MRILFGGGLVAVLLCLVGVYLLFYQAGCFGPNITLVARATSPDGKHSAMLYQGDGDAMAEPFRIVVVCEGSGGCAANGENAIASGENDGITNVHWETNDTLAISYTAGYEGFTNRRDAQDGVNIHYVAQEKVGRF